MMYQNENDFERRLYQLAGKRNIPIRGGFELSPVCNLNCKMCYVRKGKKQVEENGGLRSADEWIALAEEAREAGLLYLLLTGGEPFLYPDFRYLYTRLAQMGFRISINTNGTLIDEQTVNWLERMPPLQMNVTLYGGSESTYEALCGDGDAFTRTIGALERLKAAGIRVRVNATLTPYNLQDLELIKGIGENYGLPVKESTYLYPPVRKDRAMTGENDRFPPEEAGRIRARAAKLLWETDSFQKDRERACTCIRQETLGGGTEMPMACSAGAFAFWVTWEGRMTPCAMMTEPSIPVFEEGFWRSWEYIKDEAAKIRRNQKCSTCAKKEMCFACAAAAVAETGSYQGLPSYICSMMDAYLEELQRL